MSPRQRAWFTCVTVTCILLAALSARALAGHEPSVTLGSEQLSLLYPEALALLWSLPILACAALMAPSHAPAVQRLLALVLRCVLVLTLAVALARVVRARASTRTSVTIAIDVSNSIDDGSLARASDYTRSVVAARGDNVVRIVTFAERAHHVPLPDAAAWPLSIARHTKEMGAPAPLAASNLQAAVQLAYSLLPSDTTRRVVLLSDGNETRGDLHREALRARRLGIRIDHQGWSDHPPSEIAVRALTLPPTVEVGKPFRVHARIFATAPGRARIKLYQDELLLTADGVRELDLAAGETEVQFASTVRRPGPVRYRLALTALSADRFTENNTMNATAVVHGRPAVLVIDPQPDRLAPIVNALLVHEIDTEVRGTSALPRTVIELEPYDFVILSDVPSSALPQGTLAAIERYVRDLGGGFMLAGGASGFGLGGYQGTRMEQLMPVRMAGERMREEASLAIALVIDCSGSMAGQKLELAKEAARATAEVLADHDLIEVIGFSGQPERKVRLQSARNRVSIAHSIGTLAALGGTQVFPALDVAYRVLAAAHARIKHVILLTDGQTHETGLAELVTAMHSEAITVSTVGLGADVNRGLLQETASLGGGRTYLTNDPQAVPRIFVQEATSVKRESAVEEPTVVVANEPADFLAGIDLSLAPLLHGYVATQAKPKPAQVVIASERGEPIVSRWHVGLGYALAWTTDLKPRWAGDWLRWSSFPRLFAQLVREHMRAHKSDALPMSAPVRDDVAHVSIDAIDHDDRFINDLHGTVGFVESGTARGTHTANPRTVSLQQLGPGRYGAALPVPGYGSFALQATLERDGKIVAHGNAEASNPYPREYAALRPNDALLRRVTTLTGGLARPTAAELWRADARPGQTHEDLWPALVGFALALFLIDIGMRRVRIFDKNIG